MPQKTARKKNTVKKRRSMNPRGSALNPVASRKREFSPREDVFATAARITGSALGLGSMAIAPIVLGLRTLADGLFVSVKAPHGRGVDITQDQGPTAFAERHENDLKKREYRDEGGQLHHHTHTYMRDHSNQLRRSAA